MSLEAADVYASSVVFEPLDTNKNEIRTFLQFVKTSIGPFGKLKIVQNNSGGHVTVTSVSSRLFHVTSIKNIVLRSILSSTITHLSAFDNGGLYCSLLTLCILQNSINSSLPGYLLCELNQYFGKLFIYYLKSSENSCLHTIDFSDITDLKAVVYTIINSKPACFLTDEDKNNLSLLLLKVFLKSVPDPGENIVSRNISYYSLDGTNPKETQLLSGVLVRFPKNCRHLYYSLSGNREVLVSLFSVSLSGDAVFPSDQIIESNVSVWDEVLVHLKSLANKLIFSGVQLVLCQKVVHPSFRKHLEDNGVLVLDRLGMETAKDIEQVTGAVPVLSLSNTSSLTYGLLTAVEIIEIGKRKLFCLQNEKRPFCTILICNYNEEAAIETKAVCTQVMSTLYRLLQEPQVCSGGGCMETYTANLVRRKVLQQLSELAIEYNCHNAEVIEALNLFLKSVCDVGLSVNQGSRLTFVTEITFNHLWKLRDGDFPSEDDTCQCGKHVASTVGPSQWQFFGRTSKIENNEESSVEIVLKKPKVLDELSLKVNAATVSFSASSSLLQIGLCIS